jgi:aspartate aminotransferase-like enzyme
MNIERKSLLFGVGIGVGLCLLGALSRRSKNLPPKNVLQSELKEYSVVYTDRALNLMSEPFQQVMNDISATLKSAYKAQAAVVIPGSGTYGMEAVARQFAQDEKCLVIRNGFFSFRWSDIFDVCRITTEQKVMKAFSTSRNGTLSFEPPLLAQVIDQIRAQRPAVVFAPHVETSTGILLPNAYISAVAKVVHEVGGLFVLDCIASGTLFVNMEELGIDVVISAPQKGPRFICCYLFLKSIKWS